MWKRNGGGLIRTIAAVAGIIVIFDNRGDGFFGILLLVSVAVILFCLLGWRVLKLGEDDVFCPNKATQDIENIREGRRC
jgi:hypothetical protein